MYHAENGVNNNGLFDDSMKEVPYLVILPFMYSKELTGGCNHVKEQFTLQMLVKTL